jgi:hypothetical protein
MKSHKFNNHTIIILFCFCVLLVAGCESDANLPNDSSDATRVGGGVETLLPNHSATSVATSLPSATSSPSSIPSPRLTQTLVYYPTLPPDQARAILLDLLQNNSACRLPCWWGIIPGETSWETARSIFSPSASKIEVVGVENQFIAYAFFYTLPEDIAPAYLEIRFTVIDGTIQRIYSHGFDGLTTYNLSSFLATYGPPDEIWVHTYHSYLGASPPFAMLLFYPKQGILAYYYSREGEVEFDGIDSGKNE